MTTSSHKSSPEASRADDALSKVVRIGQLMDLYGGLLTERQRTFVQLHYEEDLSFGEIARSHGVSRQAIHDAVKHGEAALEDYEAKLQLMERGFTRTAAAATGPSEVESRDASEPESGESEADDAAPRPLAEADKLAALARQLRELHERLRRSGGIIYNGDAVAREVGAAAEELERLTSDDE